MEAALRKSLFPFSRETSPLGTRSWVDEAVDLRSILDQKLSAWLHDVSATESLFKQHIYENDNLTAFDLRQHRARLFAILSDGEHLAFAYIVWAQQTNNAPESLPEVILLDQKTKEIFKVLLEWHAPLESQQDIPESFKTAAKEVDEGKIVDFP